MIFIVFYKNFAKIQKKLHLDEKKILYLQKLKD